ncbi:MAG: DMT family transporter [Myxococcota bacterium]|nr:DMT family transporter [Myxococcota bacterium]MEC9441323.1 DMT family transporter [Myxococcota bacterium]
MGELAALSAAGVWAIASVLFAQLGEAKIPPLVMNFIKCSIALGLLWLTMLLMEGSPWPGSLTHTELAALAVSGLIGLTVGDTAYFAALTRLGPRRTLLFSTLGPPATALMAWPVLDEPITVGMILGMFLTMGGIVWVILERTSSPSTEDGEEAASKPLLTSVELLGVAFAILSVLCQATGNILTKLGGAHISSLATSVVRLSFGVMGLSLIVGLTRYRSAVLLPFKKREYTLKLLLATFLGTYLGIWLLVTGLQYASAGVAATLSSMSPVFILPIAAIFLGERLSARAIVGALIAVAGVALLFLL